MSSVPAFPKVLSLKGTAQSEFNRIVAHGVSNNLQIIPESTVEVLGTLLLYDSVNSVNVDVLQTMQTNASNISTAVAAATAGLLTLETNLSAEISNRVDAVNELGISEAAARVALQDNLTTLLNGNIAAEKAAAITEAAGYTDQEVNASAVTLNAAIVTSDNANRAWTQQKLDLAEADYIQVIDESAIQTRAIAAAATALKQDLLTVSSVVEIDRLTATGAVKADSLSYLVNSVEVDVATKLNDAETARAALEVRIQALEDYIASLSTA
jgi:hypothetical protein